MLESYPFEKMTQTYVMESTIKANWKLFLDAFQELYHVPYVHGKPNNPTGPATGIDKVPFMVPFFGKYEKHRLLSSGGRHANANVRSSRPLDALFKGGFFGPELALDIGPLGDGVNPSRLPNWGLDSWQLYPNFVILCWYQNYWYITYHYWPTDVNEHKFVFSVYFVPPKKASERVAQEYTVATVREFAIQDANTLEATQRMIELNARREYVLNDQEVLVRHLHKVVTDDVEAYRYRSEVQARCAFSGCCTRLQPYRLLWMSSSSRKCLIPTRPTSRLFANPRRSYYKSLHLYRDRRNRSKEMKNNKEIKCASGV